MDISEFLERIKRADDLDTQTAIRRAIADALEPIG
jgi:hypothetical protein